MLTVGERRLSVPEPGNRRIGLQFNLCAVKRSGGFKHEVDMHRVKWKHHLANFCSS
jgi:hypothetical protein